MSMKQKDSLQILITILVGLVAWAGAMAIDNIWVGFIVSAMLLLFPLKAKRE